MVRDLIHLVLLRDRTGLKIYWRPVIVEYEKDDKMVKETIEVAEVEFLQTIHIALKKYQDAKRVRFTLDATKLHNGKHRCVVAFTMEAGTAELTEIQHKVPACQLLSVY